MNVQSGQLQKVLRSLTSDRVTTIVGFTEIGGAGRLFNSAAVFHKGAVLGVYRKLHPAIRQSVYDAGEEMPVFRVHDLRFGIVICLDSTYAEPARRMAASGATALFVPTNNCLPRKRECADLPGLARNTDIARATENRVYVIRADVAGHNEQLRSCGSSGVVDPDGTVLHSAKALTEDLIVADIETSPCDRVTIQTRTAPD